MAALLRSCHLWHSRYSPFSLTAFAIRERHKFKRDVSISLPACSLAQTNTASGISATAAVMMLNNSKLSIEKKQSPNP